MFRPIILALAVLAAAYTTTSPGIAQVPRSADQVRLTYAPLVKQTTPAVVNIYTKKTVKQRRVMPLFDDPFFRRFFGDMAPPGTRNRVQNSLGSGVIVAADGLIITNFHVIEGADEIRVVLPDRREFEAEVVASEERNDLALLQLETNGEELPTLEFGDSDALEVGDLILAIGNPFGVGQTVTSGIISANARTSQAIGDGGVFIQIDAAINPGNSGGALVDMHGRLVGVNTAIFSRSGGSHGIGFAIPANLVKRLVLVHQTGGKVVRPWLGGEGETVRPDMAQALGLERPRGVMLLSVFPNGPLDRAGLEKNDIIFSVDGQAVDDPVAMRYRFETLAAKSAAITYWRRGQERDATVAIEPPPEDPPRNQTILKEESPFQGLRVVNVSPAVIEEMGLRGVMAGVAVDGVRRGSIAGRLGFRVGDVIEQVNKTKIARIGDVQQVVTDQPSRWRIQLRRNGKRLKMEFRS
jgi:serine protease Do